MMMMVQSNKIINTLYMFMFHVYVARVSKSLKADVFHVHSVSHRRMLQFQLHDCLADVAHYIIFQAQAHRDPPRFLRPLLGLVPQRRKQARIERRVNGDLAPVFRQALFFALDAEAKDLELARVDADVVDRLDR